MAPNYRNWTEYKESKKSELETFPVPVPPLSEQRRIVEILDQADTLRKKRVEADKIAERILPALFYKMFGDPVKNPKGFVKEQLLNLIKVKSGDIVPVKRLHPSDGFPVSGITSIGLPILLHRNMLRMTECLSSTHPHVRTRHSSSSKWLI